MSYVAFCDRCGERIGGGLHTIQIDWPVPDGNDRFGILLCRRKMLCESCLRPVADALSALFPASDALPKVPPKPAD
jgi:hypothetical protein